MATGKSSLVDVLEDLFSENITNFRDSCYSWVFFDTTDASWFPNLSFNNSPQTQQAIDIPIRKKVTIKIFALNDFLY